MLRTLPVRDPGELVELLHRYPGEPHFNGFSWQASQLMRENNQVFAGLIAAAYQPFHVRREGLEPQTVSGAYVDGSFFPVLGIKPAIGRLIGHEDDRMGDSSAVAVVSWSYWRREFNLDPAILGKQILVENVPVTVVGVTPRKFSGLQAEASQDFWLPLAQAPPTLRSSQGGSLWLVGRLKRGVSMEQARAAMAVLYESTLDEQARITNNPYLRKMKFEMEPAGAGLSRLREEWAEPLLLLMAVTGLLLLIACANIASLLLARGAARESEMALRISLGSSRFRLVRAGLTESLLLAVTGSVLGVCLAYFGAGVLVRIILAAKRMGPPIEFQVRTDASVLLFTAVVALLTGVLCGLFPALRALRSVPSSSLRNTARSGETRHRRLLGKSLVVAQVALSVVLLSAAGLFAGHLSNLEHLDLGFERDHVLLVALDPAGSGYEGARLSRADPLPAARSRMKNTVTISDTTSVTKMTGFFASARGFSLRRASTDAAAMIPPSNKPCDFAFEAMGNRSPVRTSCRRASRSARRPAQGEGRKIGKRSDDDDHADQQADEQRTVASERCRPRRALRLRRERAGEREHRHDIGETAGRRREAARYC